MSQHIGLNPKTTALVVIDLQKGIVGRQVAPYSGEQVVGNAARIVSRFRALGAFVALVRVDFLDGQDALKPRTDAAPAAGSGDRMKDWADIVPQIGVTPTDHVVTKRQWGAFYGTDLDLQLRRRGIGTIVLCGIATGVGVDTTAREAFQHGYNQVFVTDAMSGLFEEEHNYTLKYVFPRIGQNRTTDELLAEFE